MKHLTAKMTVAAAAFVVAGGVASAQVMKAEIPFRFRNQCGVIRLADLEQKLPTDDGWTGLEVQPVGHPSQPAPLIGVEDVAPLELDAANDRIRVGDRPGIHGTLGVKRKGQKQCRQRQEAPKIQMNPRYVSLCGAER